MFIGAEARGPQVISKLGPSVAISRVDEARERIDLQCLFAQELSSAYIELLALENATLRRTLLEEAKRGEK